MSAPARPRVAVVGHVEWVTHALGSLPGPGLITRLTEPFDEPAGGGGVSAAQVAKLGTECHFYTALGDDSSGRRAAAVLTEVGMRLHAAWRPHAQTRALSAVDVSGDRAIAVIGPATAPVIDDDLPWDALSGFDAAYFTGHDPATLVAARRARRLVVTTRRLRELVVSGVRPDVLVASANDPFEAVDPAQLPVQPDVILWTEGGDGGRFRHADGREGRWAPARPPGAPVDSYGCGDSFAAGVTVGLGRGLDLQGALTLGARCGAANLTARGGLPGQLTEPGPPPA